MTVIVSYADFPISMEFVAIALPISQL